jgi:hypothetical protein
VLVKPLKKANEEFQLCMGISSKINLFYDVFFSIGILLSLNFIINLVCFDSFDIVLKFFLVLHLY